MWSYSESLSLRDFFAVEILKGLMLRQGQPGYSDLGAIDAAYQLSDYMVERRDATTETAEAGQKPSTNSAITQCLCESCTNNVCEGMFPSAKVSASFTVHECSGYSGTAQ